MYIYANKQGVSKYSCCTTTIVWRTRKSRILKKWCSWIRPWRLCVFLLLTPRGVYVFGWLRYNKYVDQTYIYEKWRVKETYVREKRHMYVKRDICIWKETCMWKLSTYVLLTLYVRSTYSLCTYYLLSMCVLLTLVVRIADSLSWDMCITSSQLSHRRDAPVSFSRTF